MRVFKYSVYDSEVPHIWGTKVVYINWCLHKANVGIRHWVVSRSVSSVYIYAICMHVCFRRGCEGSCDLRPTHYMDIVQAWNLELVQNNPPSSHIFTLKCLACAATSYPCLIRLGCYIKAWMLYLCYIVIFALNYFYAENINKCTTKFSHNRFCLKQI